MEKTVSTHGNVKVIYDGCEYKTVHRDGTVLSSSKEYHRAFVHAQTTRGYTTPYGTRVYGEPRNERRV